MKNNQKMEGNKLGTEEYIHKLKSAKGGAEEVTEKIKYDKLAEYESTKAELEIEKLRSEIQRIRKESGTVEPETARGFIGQILAANLSDPARAKVFLDALGEEDLQKLSFLMAAESDRSGAIMNLLKSPGTNIRDIVEIVKLMRPSNGGVDLKGIAEVFKMGIEAARSNQPPPQSQEQGFKYVYETFVKPFTEALSAQQQETMNARVDALKAQIPPPIDQQIASIKKMAGDLGLAGGGKTSEVDLRLEEMRQSHDLDLERIRWEQQKFMLQSEAERDKWGAIQQTFAPVFAMAAPEIRNQLRKAGGEVGKMLNPGNPQKGPSTEQQIAPFTCPQCNAELTVPIPPNAPDVVPIKCPKCGTVTEAQIKSQTGEAPPPSEEKPRSSRLSYKMG